MTDGNRNFLQLVDSALSEAVAWRISLSEAGTQSTLDFEIWLAQGDHERAWDQVNSVWKLFEDHSSEPAMLEVRHSALGDVKRKKFRLASIPMVIGVAATIFICLIGAGWVWRPWTSPTLDYQTALGERRVVSLSDGSVLSLDSATEVTVKFSRHARDLKLVRGQARFDVAHDVTRPFSVLVRDQKVIATGTAFNINLTAQKVAVTLIEGHLLVLNQAARAEGTEGRVIPASVELRAGQRLEEDEERPPQVTTANIEQTTAWMNGQAIIDNDTLAAVVAQVNHYSHNPITIDDPDVAAMRISGVFNVADEAAFLDIVTHYLPVRAVSTCSGGIRIESRKD